MNSRNIISAIVAITAAVILSGCNPTSIKRNSKMEDAFLYYKIQMNRSAYLEAARFRASDSRWDVRGLEQFQISHYEIKQSSTSNNGNTVERTVLLRYIDRHTMRERSTLYKEIWNYEPEKGGWRLSGEPPVIR